MNQAIFDEDKSSKVLSTKVSLPFFCLLPELLVGAGSAVSKYLYAFGARLLNQADNRSAAGPATLCGKRIWIDGVYLLRSGLTCCHCNKRERQGPPNHLPGSAVGWDLYQTHTGCEGHGRSMVRCLGMDHGTHIDSSRPHGDFLQHTNTVDQLNSS